MFFARILSEDDLTPPQTIEWLDNLDRATLGMPVLIREDVESVPSRRRDVPAAEEPS